jgi:hypothetical protein
MRPTDFYEVAGPVRDARSGRLVYRVRRVLHGQRYDAGTGRSLEIAIVTAKAIRGRDAKTFPERADWPIFHAL